jgi:hypothetical protein
VPAKQKFKREIQFWLRGNPPDGHDYEDFI